MRKPKTTTITIPLCLLALVLCGLRMLGILNIFKSDEARAEHTFKAAVVNVRTTRHPSVDCPRLNERSEAQDVIRLTFDRKVPVWSETGTGDGKYELTDSIDLPAAEYSKWWGPVLFTNPATFHYSVSFLSVCDGSRIPVVRNFR
jgi:hypothetical protein